MTRRIPSGELLLVLVAIIWGMGFVSQGVGMDYVGPFTFHSMRSLVGLLTLLPIILIRRRKAPNQQTKSKKTLIVSTLASGFMMCAGSILQMIGQDMTSVGKAGFITALYILFVPLIGMILGRKVRKIFWLGVLTACVGMYFLCIKDGFSIGLGDVLILIGALMFAGQILVIDHVIARVDEMQFSGMQLMWNVVFAAPFMLMLEHPSIEQILSAWMPLLYSGVLSSAIAFTLQVFAQRRVNPVVASLIMSLESVFAAIGGWLVLNQALSGREMLGCALVFAAVLLAQWPSKADRLPT